VVVSVVLVVVRYYSLLLGVLATFVPTKIIERELTEIVERRGVGKRRQNRGREG